MLWLFTANAEPLQRPMERNGRFGRRTDSGCELKTGDWAARRLHRHFDGIHLTRVRVALKCRAANGLLRDSKGNCDHPETSAHITGVHAEIAGAQNCASESQISVFF
jgi:hypothetical protein